MDKRVSRETCTERKAWRVWTRTKEACGQACGKDHFVSDGHLQALVMYLAVHREEASDPLSHRGTSCQQGVQQQTNSHVTQDVFATSTMWTRCAMAVFSLHRPSCHPNTHAFQFQLCNGCILHLTMHLTFFQNCTQS